MNFGNNTLRRHLLFQIGGAARGGGEGTKTKGRGQSEPVAFSGSVTIQGPAYEHLMSISFLITFRLPSRAWPTRFNSRLKEFGARASGAQWRPVRLSDKVFPPFFDSSSGYSQKNAKIYKNSIPKPRLLLRCPCVGGTRAGEPRVASPRPHTYSTHTHNAH